MESRYGLRPHCRITASFSAKTRPTTWCRTCTPPTTDRLSSPSAATPDSAAIAISTPTNFRLRANCYGAQNTFTYGTADRSSWATIPASFLTAMAERFSRGTAAVLRCRCMCSTSTPPGRKYFRTTGWWLPPTPRRFACRRRWITGSRPRKSSSLTKKKIPFRA